MSSPTDEESDLQPGNTPLETFPIVGVGALAGGLEAFTELLKNLPPRPGLALVLVQHLDPHHVSILSEILSRETTLPVLQATDGLAVEQDHLYVIPPNMALTIAQGRLRLHPRDLLDKPFMPIDIFFRSLARDAESRAVCVVLSGGGTDGALGLEEIKGADGVTFVQDESTARQTAMPLSAMATGYANYVMTPAQIAHTLVKLPQVIREAGRQPLLGQSAMLPKIFGRLRSATGLDFSQYKRTTVNRRIDRRMSFNAVNNLEDYATVLDDQPDEVHALCQDLLIRVTSFFRDPAIYERLQSVVFPAMLQNRASAAPIRIWAAGCSTGEEVYSLAIALIECIGDMASNTPVKILATDVNDVALDKARSGTYVDNIALDVSPERLRRFFTKSNGSYQISKSIRDLCVFSRHNVTRDTPFANLDLISCRNLLIYFESPLQKRVLPYFYYALKPGGYLMLGTAETIGSHKDLFEIVDSESRIYVKKQTRTRIAIDFPVSDRAFLPRHADESQPIEATEQDDMDVAHRLLVQRYAPPRILIDEQSKVLQISGKVTPCIQSRSEQPLAQVLHQDLRGAVQQAVEAAKTQKIPIRTEKLQVRQDDQSYQVSVEVIPLLPTASSSRTFLLLFEDQTQESPKPGRHSPSESGSDADEVPTRVDQLERQLALAREHLQITVEENEAASEELKASNEEILSSNEELQSTNEELQTTKEEMQSTNEELATVNEELKHRNVELGQLNDDLGNLLGGLNIPIIMVNRELRIRRFTPPAQVLFNLIPSDVGRRISDLRPNIELPDLAAALDKVIHTLTSVEFEVQDRVGHWYSLRIRPYVTADNRIDGAVLLLVDVDALKQAAEKLTASRNSAEAIVQTVGAPLLVLDQDLRVQRANAAFYQTFRLQATDVEGQRLLDLEQSPWRQPELFAQVQRVIPDDETVRDLEIQAEFPNVGLRTISVSAQRMFWEGSGAPMILLAIDDITNRKQELEQARLLAMEQAARAEAEAASRMKDEFLAMLAHELRNPLAPIRNTFFILRQRITGDALVDHALDISERQITHMARLLDDLLDVSRITRGKIQLRTELIDLQTAITRAVEGSHPLIDQRGHQLEVVTPAETVYLEADPARLDQIFTNLLNNAAKYTDPGGTIRVSAALENGWVVIRISDSGVGIAPHLLPKIFELFMQADHSLDRSQGGLGIGLTLVRTLAELHGGKVEALSEGLGKGSTFVVRLPALRPRERSATSLQPGEQTAGFKPRSILVVDDNLDSATTMAMFLRHVGHRVSVAHSGTQALAMTKAERPEVILLDIGLPEMNGYEVAEKIRHELQMPEILIIAVTGYGKEDDRRIGKEVGIDHHLVKPVNLHELETILAAGR